MRPRPSRSKPTYTLFPHTTLFRSRAAEEDAAQHQGADPLGMRLGIGERQGRAPGTAEHLPAHDAEVVAQALHVGGQMRRGVFRNLPQGRRAPGTALVEHDDAVVAGAEEAVGLRPGPGARPGDVWGKRWARRGS